MPPTFGTRTERRAFSRDAARHYATTRLRDGATQPSGPNRRERRKNGERHGDISLLVHGTHNRAWLHSPTVNGGGQARINNKRNQRAAYWKNFRRQGEMGHALRDRIQEAQTLNSYRAEHTATGTAS